MNERKVALWVIGPARIAGSAPIAGDGEPHVHFWKR
jgi:hypothetical protein